MAPSIIYCAFIQFCPHLITIFSSARNRSRSARLEQALFCSHLKMRLSETKDELAQCFASVSILSNHDFSA